MSKTVRKSDAKRQDQVSAVIEEITDEPIAGSCFHTDKNGVTREFTPEEYAATPRGHIFIGIGGFKPPAGKTYKPEKSIEAQPIDHAEWSNQVGQQLVETLNRNVLAEQQRSQRRRGKRKPPQE